MNIQVHIVHIVSGISFRIETNNYFVVILTHKLRNKLIDKSVNQHKGQYTENMLGGRMRPPMQTLPKWILQ